MGKQWDRHVRRLGILNDLAWTISRAVVRTMGGPRTTPEPDLEKLFRHLEDQVKDALREEAERHVSTSAD